MKHKLGIIIGRFQVPELHSGHRRLIATARDECERLLILVGDSIVKDSRSPLSFIEREAMILDSLTISLGCRPDGSRIVSNIVPLADAPTDKLWSDNIDKIINIHYPWLSCDDICAYGGRDNSLSSYWGSSIGHGHVIDEVLLESGTASRVNLGAFPMNAIWRAGAINALNNQFPTSYQCVDIAPIYSGKVVLARKEWEEKPCRFIGGFVDPTDDSLESAAWRECLEEAPGLSVDRCNVKYVTSIRVDDWRYRKSPHKIMSALFTAPVNWGNLKAGDDVAELGLVDPNSLLETLIDDHREMGRSLLDFLKKNT